MGVYKVGVSRVWHIRCQLKSLLASKGLYVHAIRSYFVLSVYRINLNQQQRKQCYKARDAFYECSIKNKEAVDTECEELKKLFHSSCPPSWVSWLGG